MEQTLGKRISHHRKRLGLTQDALAEQLGITAQAVSKWEHDLSCPDITMLPKLASIFGISTDELLGMDAHSPVYDAEVVQEDTPHRDGVHVQNGRWEFHWDAGRKSSLMTALCVLLVGVLTMVSRILSWDVSFWSILWPSALLFLGLNELFSRFNVFHLALTLFGGYALICNLNFLPWNLTWELVFPLCLVLFGAGQLVEALRKPKKPSFEVKHYTAQNNKLNKHYHAEGEEFECSLSFGSLTQAVTLPRLSEGDIDVSFGELTIDLSGCEQVSSDCSIDANCAFGELTILVPTRFTVVTDQSTAFVALNIHGQPDPQPEGTIDLDANVSFGQIKICYQ